MSEKRRRSSLLQDLVNKRALEGESQVHAEYGKENLYVGTLLICELTALRL